MSDDRIHVQKDVSCAQRKMPYVVLVDGKYLRQKCGHKSRRFAKPETARAAAELYINSIAS